MKRLCKIVASDALVAQKNVTDISIYNSGNRFIRTNRLFHSICQRWHTAELIYSVGAGADAVDYKLISVCHKGDVVVSQDYGVAAMALGKGAYAIHQSGKWYTNENIDQMLMERHLNKKARRGSHKNHIKGPRKRTEEDDERFAQSFEKMILMAKSKEGGQIGTV